MENYYELLKLNPKFTVDEIKEELAQQENVWRKREVTRPEAAMEKLALINRAKKVFETESTKANYDLELFAVPEEKPEATSDNGDTSKEFARWYDEAYSYLEQKQYDLAKTALEKAISIYNNEDNCVFCAVAAQIYRLNNDFSIALNYINKAILLNSNEGENYLIKALIYDGQYVYEYNNYKKSDDNLVTQMRNNLNTAIEKARAQNNNLILGRALGCLANTLCFTHPKNIDLAEQYANEAIGLGEDWSNGAKALAEISRIRADEQARIDAANARQAEIDAENARRREEAERIQKEREEAEAKKLARKKRMRKLRRNIVLLILVCIIGAAIFVASKVNSIGRGLKYNFDKSTGTLTISGKGEMNDYSTNRFDIKTPWDLGASGGGFDKILNMLVIKKVNKNDIKKVVVEDGVTKIGNNSLIIYHDCEYDIADSVEVYSRYCIWAEYSSEIKISKNVKSIGYNAFVYAKKLKYEGSLLDWTKIKCVDLYEDHYLGFYTRGAVTVECSDGSITGDESSGYALKFNGSIGEFDSQFDTNAIKNCEKIISVVCSNGVIK